MSKLHTILAAGTLAIGVAASFFAAATGFGAQASKTTNLADNCDFSEPPPRWACGSMGNRTQDKTDAPTRTMPSGPSVIPRIIT